jgi:prepilin-type N-terminal cleavage/methylation domain-containing protein
MSNQRGFSLAEMIVSTIILGLMLVAIASLALPTMTAPLRGSAKAETVFSAAYGLDIIERDIRGTDVSGVFACTANVTVTCSQPTALTTTPYLAVLTAYNAAGVFQPSCSTTPCWVAYVVYSQPSGNIIYRTYQAWQTPPATPLAGAVAAVTAVSLLPNGTAPALPDAQSMAIAVNNANGQVSLQVISAAGAGPTQNSSTYTTTVLARN